MPKRVSGRRYAEAIFELALQEDQVEQWATELELVSQVLQDEDFSGFLKHADVPVDQKIKSIDSVLAQVHPGMDLRQTESMDFIFWSTGTSACLRKPLKSSS